jgi:hypothetical protein
MTWRRFSSLALLLLQQGSSSFPLQTLHPSRQSNGAWCQIRACTARRNDAAGPTLESQVIPIAPLPGDNWWRLASTTAAVLILSSLLPLSASAATDEVPSVTANTPVSGTATVVSRVTSHANDQTPRQWPYQWTFPNGKVTLPTVTRIGPTLQLVNPTLLGSGSGGAVFATQHYVQSSTDESVAARNADSDLVALKVSWSHSAESVANECRVLQTIQARAIRRPLASLEICLGKAPYATDDNDEEDLTTTESEKRTMIALQPVFVGPQVSTLTELEPQQLVTAVDSLVQTMVQLLSIGVVTVDVQPLISRTTGQVLLIDFTEARVLVEAPASDAAATIAIAEDRDTMQPLVSSFISEVMSLIPTPLQETLASDSLIQSLNVYPPPSSLLLRQCSLDVLSLQNFSPDALHTLQARWAID